MKNTIFTILIICIQLFAGRLGAQGWQWAKGSYCSDSAGGIEVGPVVVDKSGNSYQTGYFATPAYSTHSLITSTFGAITVTDSDEAMEQGFVVSTNAAGAYRWVVYTHHAFAEISGIAIDGQGNTYATGFCFAGLIMGSQYYSGNGDFCAKIDSSGNVLWIKNVLPSTDAICALNDGSFYVGGAFGGTSLSFGGVTLTNADPTGATSDIFYAKFDSSGNMLWAKKFGGSGNETFLAMSLTGDSELYIAGNSSSASMVLGPDTLSPGGGSPFYLAKIGRTGNALWGKTISATGYDKIEAITSDMNGNAYVTGYFAYNIAFGSHTLTAPQDYSMFFTKFDSSGNAQWAKTMPRMNFGWGLVADACGNIWVSGQTEGEGVLSDSMFLAEYDTAGNLEDTLFLNGGDEDGTGVAVDGKGNLYVSGDYLVSQFIVGNDTLQLINHNSEVLYILKYLYDTNVCEPVTTTKVGVTTTSPGISLYPNPTAGECTIHNDAGFKAGSKVDVYDVMGRLIHTYPLTGNDTQIPIGNMTPGTYECRIYSAGYTAETKSLVIIR